MKARKTFLVTMTTLAGLSGQGVAQLPVTAPPAPLAPPPAPIGVADTPGPPTGAGTIWEKLGISKKQLEYCKRKICRTPLGQLLSNARAPFTALSGGLIGPFCPSGPSAAELADPGAVGAAAKVKADEAAAKERKAAVRYLGTVDCHYWPEAEGALIGALRGDRNECVRYEAAQALGSGCCCTKKVIEALNIVVSCSDRDGAPKETSQRVHAAAHAALSRCLACYTAPAEEKKIEVKPPPEGPVAPPPEGPDKPAVQTALATTKDGPKPIDLGEVKPAAGVKANAAPRPTGPEYYALIARQPLGAIVAEGLRTVREHQPAVPFRTGEQSVTDIVTFAAGPELMMVDGMVVSLFPRAEEVSPRPVNLWDLITQPPETMVVIRSEVVQPTGLANVTPQSTAPPPIAMTKPSAPPLEMPRSSAPIPATAINPVAQPMQMPRLPAPTPATLTKSAAPPREMPRPSAPIPATAINPVAQPMQMPRLPAPTPAAVTKPAAPPVAPKLTPPPAPVSTPKPLATDLPPSVPVLPPPPQILPSPNPAVPLPTVSGPAAAPKPVPAPSEPTRILLMKPANMPPAREMILPQPSAPKEIILPRPAAAQETALPPFAAPAKETLVPPPQKLELSLPAEPAPAPVAPPASAPAPAPAVAPTSATESAKATEPALQAMNVFSGVSTPAERWKAADGLTWADVRSAPELVKHLLAAAQVRGDSVEVRVACVRALVRCQVRTPLVFTALEGLSEDPVPAVRGEAIIGLARLRLAGQANAARPGPAVR